MKFGSVPLDEAAGAVLAHSVQTEKGRLRKGLVLTGAHLMLLRATGLEEVIVARLGPDDCPEDDAAATLACALVGKDNAHLRLTTAATGRVNIHATAPGLLHLNVSAIHALNRVDPMITLATLPQWQRVAAGTMVATVKIIAYGVAQVALQEVAALARGAMALAPPTVRDAMLIETQVPGQVAPQGDVRAAKALSDRLARLDVSLGPVEVVAHREDRLAAALSQAKADVIFVLTGSATSDIDDVGPAALRLAGGKVVHFGMPVDPGNLLFLGELGARPVIGLPGCARSPALNGADWVLERVICGHAPDADDIANMGVGGLLKEIRTRPRPREG